VRRRSWVRGSCLLSAPVALALAALLGAAPLSGPARAGEGGTKDILWKPFPGDAWEVGSDVIVETSLRVLNVGAISQKISVRQDMWISVEKADDRGPLRAVVSIDARSAVYVFQNGKLLKKAAYPGAGERRAVVRGPTGAYSVEAPGDLSQEVQRALLTLVTRTAERERDERRAQETMRPSRRGWSFEAPSLAQLFVWANGRTLRSMMSVSLVDTAPRDGAPGITLRHAVDVEVIDDEGAVWTCMGEGTARHETETFFLSEMEIIAPIVVTGHVKLPDTLVPATVVGTGKFTARRSSKRVARGAVSPLPARAR